ncbi:MAG: deoxyribonuclease IV [Pirellulaceae bacterium]|nr:deoxyribonuclease IV [Pirellulaceae bacterium]
MYCFGSHVSCAGGLLAGVDRAQQLGCQCLQVFVSSPRSWPSPQGLIPLRSVKSRSAKVATLESATSAGRVGGAASEDPAEFRSYLATTELVAPIAHACYLINLASSDSALWEKSVAALVIEWSRAEQLGLDGIVLHPGSHTTATPEQGMHNIVRGVSEALRRVAPKRCSLLLENTAGQGSCLGWKIEQLGWLLETLDCELLGVCWDTCHALAAGYDFRSPAGLQAMIDELRQYRVLERIGAVHANDSLKDCGSRVDRHEHIGLGRIGQEGWQLFLHAPEFRMLPMYLETEKGVDDNGVDWDERNLAALRSLAASR